MKSRQTVSTILASCGVFLLSVALGQAAVLTWSGVNSNLWTTVSPYTNWFDGANNVVWSQGADAVFDGEPVTQVNVSGGTRQFNSLTVSNIVDGDMTIGKISGNDVDRLEGVGAHTVWVESGTTLRLPQVAGSVGLTVDGGGLLLSTRGFVYTGGTFVKNGTLQALPSAGSGTITLLDTTGSADARVYIRGVNSSWLLAEPITVQSGSSGIAIIENSPTTSSGFTPIISGDIALGNWLRVRLSGTQTSNLTLSGSISGPGTLELYGNGTTAQTFILSGDNSGHTGPLVMQTNTSNKNLQLDGTQGNANITVGSGVDIFGSGTLTYNVNNDTADLVTLGAGSTFDLTGLTLQPQFTGTQSQNEYVLVSTTSGVTGPFAAVVNYGLYTFDVDYDGTALNPGKVVLTYTLVPEPMMGGLLLFGGLVMWSGRRRSRSSGSKV